MALQNYLSPPAYHQMQVDRLKAKARAKQPSPILLLSWMQKYRRMLVPDRPFDLEHHPYLLDIYNCTARRIVVMKAAQMGLSEWTISRALWSADQRQATVLYVFPTDSHVSDFSSARIGPAIEASPYLSSIVVEGGAVGGKRGADRVTLKRVRDRFIYLRGARVDPDGTAAQLKSIDADVLMLDELDEMDMRAPVIARKRLGHSVIGEEIAISTPTHSGAGIHAEYEHSDKRRWNVKCDGCGTWQAPVIEQVVAEFDKLGRPVTWNGQREGRAWAACVKCGREIDRLGAGQWVAESPGRAVAGFHVNKLCSSLVNLLDLVRALQTADETERQEAYNQDLGLPYTPRGGQMSDEALDACRREYAHGAVAGEWTAMGVDVGRVLHCVIRGRPDRETGEIPQRWAGEVDSFEALAALMRKYNVVTVVIDALPETTKARELQAMFKPGVVWLAYYTLHKKQVEYTLWNADDMTVALDRTRALDAMCARMYGKIATLPAHARDVPDYYRQLKSPVRTVKDGEAVYIETGPDHLAHAETYCMIAESFLSNVPEQDVIYAPVRIGPSW